MLSFSNRRKLIKLRDQINTPLALNPFIFSKAFLIWTILGALGGIIGGVYWNIIDYFMHITKSLDAFWQVVSVMGIAGLLVGIIIYFAGDPGSLSIVLNNIRFKGGRLDTEHNPSLLASSIIGISAGSSAGPEAPMVQVIGSIGSWMAKKLRFRLEDHRSMTIAGMASGFTAMFGVPLAGALFALEVIHHKHVVQYYAALIPAFVSSGTTFIVFQWITGLGVTPFWLLPWKEISPKLDYIYLAILYGIISAAIGWIIILTFRFLKDIFKKINMPIYVQTTIAGIILGVLAWKFPVTRYFSKHEIVDLMNGTWTVGVLIAIMFTKIFSMALTVTSGWRGGFIIPILFIGAALGMIIPQLIPGLQIGLAVVCCMAAVNSCVTRTPISSIILVGTLTGFNFFIPILFASLTGFFLAPKSPLIAAQLGKEESILEN